MKTLFMVYHGEREGYGELKNLVRLKTFVLFATSLKTR
jgi:hypothetical protein